MDQLTCPHCQRGFKQRTNLRRHLRTACPRLVTAPPYSCERGCGRTFYRADMRARHHRYCDHGLVATVHAEDPDALDVYASDQELEESEPAAEWPTPSASPAEATAWIGPGKDAAGGPSAPVAGTAGPAGTARPHGLAFRRGLGPLRRTPRPGPPHYGMG